MCWRRRSALISSPSFVAALMIVVMWFVACTLGVWPSFVSRDVFYIGENMECGKVGFIGFDHVPPLAKAGNCLHSCRVCKGYVSYIRGFVEDIRNVFFSHLGRSAFHRCVSQSHFVSR
jgi:hypothetical protein